MDRNRCLCHDAEAQNRSKELEHFKVCRTTRRWINHETVSIRAVIVPIVRRLDKEGQQVRFKLVHDVVESLAEGTACIDAPLPNELSVVASGVDSLLTEHAIIRVGLTALLENLAEDRDSALMVDFAFGRVH